MSGTIVSRRSTGPSELPLEAEARRVLERALVASGVTRTELAKRLGIDRSRVSNVLNGVESNLTVRTLDAYLAALGFTAIIRLCGGDSPAEPEEME